MARYGRSQAHQADRSSKSVLSWQRTNNGEALGSIDVYQQEMRMARSLSFFFLFLFPSLLDGGKTRTTDGVFVMGTDTLTAGLVKETRSDGDGND